MIGLARGKVKTMPYCYEWKELYMQEEKLLYSIIGDYVIDIEHAFSIAKTIVKVSVILGFAPQKRIRYDKLRDPYFVYLHSSQ